MTNPQASASSSHRFGRRVVITGYGANCALGHSIAALTEALRTGRSGVRLHCPDATGPGDPAAVHRCEDLDAALSMSDRALFDPVTRYAIRAARDALENSGLLLYESRDLLTRAGVYLGTAMGGMPSVEEAYAGLYYHGSQPKPLALLNAMTHAPGSHIAIRYGIRGPNLTYSVGCTSSAIAIGEAFHAVRSGRLECALAGGAEASVTRGFIAALRAMRVIATPHPTAPESACRPFSMDRTGLVPGDGAAMVVVEPYESATRRGALILAEVLGFATGSDASHICIPSAEGMASTMTAALRDADLAPDLIDYVNANGSATRVGDITEARAIHLTFGEHARSLPVSSTKSVHGHLMGAAGALEFVVSLIALRERFLPATMHHKDLDPECDLDVVPNVPRFGVRIRRFLSNSTGFGGSNAALIAGTPTSREED